jgi:hypothetical protein
MRAQLEPEGWQAEKYHSQRVYHYIRGTLSLCRKLGFYTGEVTPDNPSKRTKEDCSACVKQIERERRKAAASAK